MAYSSINKIDINGAQYILHDLTDGTYIVEIPEITKDEVFAIQSKVNSDLYKKVDKVSGKGLSANDFTDAFKSKLEGIEDNANKYIHPSYTARETGLYKVSVDKSGHVNSVVKVEKSDITDLGIPPQDTTYVDMVGASTSADGQNGLVPAPSKGEATRYLRSDGAWVVPPDTQYPMVSSSTDGRMSKEDKIKLDGIEESANNYSLPKATNSVLGGVTQGENVNISNGVISVANSSTTQKGVVQLNDALDSTSTSTAATANAIKKVSDNLTSSINTVNQTITDKDTTVNKRIDTEVQTLNDTITSSVNTVDTKIDSSINTVNGSIATIKTTADAALPLAGGTMTGAIDMGNKKITNLATPTDDNDAVTKAYADAISRGSSDSAGQSVAGKSFTIDDTTVTAGEGAEIFNDYTNNKATGAYSHAEGSGTIVSGKASHAEGEYTTASGRDSHAEGNDTTASGNYSYAGGFGTTASGVYSRAEGYSTSATGTGAHSEGTGVTAAGDYSHAEGIDTTASGVCSYAKGYRTKALDYQTVIGLWNNPMTAAELDGNTGTLFIIGNGSDDAATANAFRVAQDGNCYCQTTFVTSGADYAEAYEWLDGNENNEDRRGRFVTLDGIKIKYATSNDDYVLGVVSGNPAVVGDHSDDWHGRWVTDIFGTRITKKKINTDGKEVNSFVESEDYDRTQTYIPRKDRKEWSFVGTHGKLVVIDDGTCIVNGYCMPANDGIATKSDSGYRVVERIDETHVRIVIK